MSKVIVFTNENGNVSVCYPTGELSIEETQIKDTPAGSIIIDDSELPTDSFDAWELIDGKVVVNETKKAIIQSKTAIKESALSKLAALGLTQDEIKAIL